MNSDDIVFLRSAIKLLGLGPTAKILQTQEVTLARVALECSHWRTPKRIAPRLPLLRATVAEVSR